MLPVPLEIKIRKKIKHDGATRSSCVSKKDLDLMAPLIAFTSRCEA